MSAVGTPWVTARSTKNDPPRNPPTCGIRSVSIAQTAANGASGTPSNRPSVEHVQAHQDGHGDGAAEVAAERAVDDPTDVVGLCPAGRGEQAAEAAEQVLAVDQHGDGDAPSRSPRSPRR